MYHRIYGFSALECDPLEFLFCLAGLHILRARLQKRRMQSSTPAQRAYFIRTPISLLFVF